MGKPLKNLLGQTFGFLEVIAREGTAESGAATWLCRCQCGKEIVRDGRVLRDGRKIHQKSCGCHFAAIRGKHRQSYTPLYKRWVAIRVRCSNENSPAYKYYGGRGITVCPRWDTSFESFIEDMGASFKPGLTLDREDNNGPYSPENCRWVSRKVQQNNTRWNKLIDTSKGRMTVAEASEAFDIEGGMLRSRLLRGWPVEEALTLPAQKGVRFDQLIDTPKGRMTVPQAAEAYGLPAKMVAARLAKGIPVEVALTTDPQPGVKLVYTT